MMKITPAPMRVPTTIFLPVLQPCPTTFTDRTLSKANVSVTILPAFVNCRSNPESVMDPSLPRILCLSASLTSTTEPAGICVNCSFTPCGGAAATWHAPLADAEDDHSSRAVQSRATWFRTIHTSSRHRLNIRVAESGFGYVTLAAPEYTRRTPRGRKRHFRGSGGSSGNTPDAVGVKHSLRCTLFQHGCFDCWSSRGLPVPTCSDSSRQPGRAGIRFPVPNLVARQLYFASDV